MDFFLSFLTLLFTIFNKGPHSKIGNKFNIVSFDIIKSLQRVCDEHGFTKFLTIYLTFLLVLLLQLISM